MPVCVGGKDTEIFIDNLQERGDGEQSMSLVSVVSVVSEVVSMAVNAVTENGSFF